MVKLTITWSSHFLDMALLFLCCMPWYILPIKNYHLSVIIFKKKWRMILFSLMLPLCWVVIASYSPRAANLRCLFCVSLCLRKHCSLFVFLHVQVKAWTLFVCSFLSRSKDDFQKTSWRPWGICLRKIALLISHCSAELWDSRVYHMCPWKLCSVPQLSTSDFIF